MKMKKNKHNLYSDVVKKLMFLSSQMLCGSHFCPFSPISQVECETRLMSALTELE
jgi:hypothetical protein